MKLTTHDRIPKPTEMTLGAKPLRVLLTKHVELVIEKGDTIAYVAQAIASTWRHLDDKSARRLAAYYFAIGERRAGLRPNDSEWSDTELSTSLHRRYLSR
jgi:hypothetical protein